MTEEEIDNAAVDKFAAAMKAKLAVTRAKGRSGRHDPDQCSVEYLHQLLDEQMQERAVLDPVDIGNLAAMIFNREPLHVEPER